MSCVCVGFFHPAVLYLLSELNLLPSKVFWWQQCLRFWNKIVAAPLDSFHRTVLLDNLQDAVRFRIRNFSSSVAVALQSVGPVQAASCTGSAAHSVHNDLEHTLDHTCVQ